MSKEFYKIYIPQVNEIYSFDKDLLKLGFLDVMNFFILKIPEYIKYQRFYKKENNII